MDLLKSYLHNIDIATKKATKIQLNINSRNITEYIEELLSEILKNPNKRIYNFKPGSTEVKTSLIKLLNDDSDIENVILLNAERLLEKEIETQEFLSSKNLDVKIQKGSLMHLYFLDDNVHKIIICKVEHDEILNELTFDKISGLNTTRKVFKAILIVFSDNQQFIETTVFDKNNSKYWWSEFLELRQSNTDNDNTEKSLIEIDNVLRAYKKDYYSDYTIIRNGIISHYRNNEHLNFSEILDNEIINYDPINTNFPKQRLIASLNDLPTKKGFDSQFTIIKKSINKRIRHRIKLATNLYLSMDDSVENLKNIIKTYIDKSGNKIVQIISAEGYEQLKDLK